MDSRGILSAFVLRQLPLLLPLPAQLGVPAQCNWAIGQHTCNMCHAVKWVAQNVRQGQHSQHQHEQPRHPGLSLSQQPTYLVNPSLQSATCAMNFAGLSQFQQGLGMNFPALSQFSAAAAAA